MILTVTSQSVLCRDSPLFQWSLHAQDLHKKEETLVFEAHGMSFPCTDSTVSPIIQLRQGKGSFLFYGTFKIGLIPVLLVVIAFLLVPIIIRVLSNSIIISKNSNYRALYEFLLVICLHWLPFIFNYRALRLNFYKKIPITELYMNFY